MVAVLRSGQLEFCIGYSGLSGALLSCGLSHKVPACCISRTGAGNESLQLANENQAFEQSTLPMAASADMNEGSSGLTSW
jgi:hypothetical protein